MLEVLLLWHVCVMQIIVFFVFISRYKPSNARKYTFVSHEIARNCIIHHWFSWMIFYPMFFLFVYHIFNWSKETAHRFKNIGWTQSSDLKSFFLLLDGSYEKSLNHMKKNNSHLLRNIYHLSQAVWNRESNLFRIITFFCDR